MNAITYRQTTLWAALLGLLATGTAAAQTTLYSHNFTGGAVTLNGVLVEGGALSGSTAWATNNFANADGSLVGANEGSAILPITLSANATYTLTMDVNILGGVDRWVGLGFTDAATLASAGASNANDRFSNNGGRGWMLVRDDDAPVSEDVQMFAGANVTGPADELTGAFGADYDIEAGVYTLRIVYDTTGGLGSSTATFSINDGGGFDTLVSGLAVDLSAVSSVGFTYDNAATPTHSVDNFLLTELITGPVLNTWNVDADGLFSNGANWTQGAPTPGSDVAFGTIITANRTVTLSSSASLNSITFDNAGDGDYFLVPQTNQTLTLTGAASINTSGRHWLRIPVAGTVGLNASGAGELVLDAANTFTGGLTVDDTNLAIVHSQALPAGNAVTIQNNGNVNFWGPDNGFFTDQGSTGYVSGTVGNAISIDGTSFMAINDGAVVTFSGAISGAGAVNVGGGEVTFSTAKTYTGVTTVSGGFLRLTGGGTLGASDGTAASQTVVTGNQATGQLQLPGIAVGNEVLLLGARELAAADAVHVTSSGTSSWAGNIKGDVGGTQYNIESTSGTLTLGGILSAPDSGERNFVFSGAGNTRINGRITDLASGADGTPTVTNAVSSVNVSKRGAGTLTVATASASQDDYWLGETVIEEGTLEVLSDGANNGELWSSNIDVRAGAILDVDHFGTYSLQPGQGISGGGTIRATGKTVAIFADNNVAPGDSVGTLRVEGNVSLSSIGAGGTWTYELGDSTTVGGTENDLLQVTGSLTGTLSSNASVRVIAAEGDLATAGVYRLASAASGTPTVAGVPVQFVSNTGAAINPRQTGTLSSAVGQINLTINGSEESRTWNGAGANNVWDVNVTNPWTGGDQRFRDLDDVTFGAGGIKQVVVNSEVSPGSVVFNGGAASTYEFSGSGGITGYGPVSVNSGTVRLLNRGNDFRGTTTIANGARLEVDAASAGGMVVNGTLAVRSTIETTLVDDFNTPGLGQYNFAKVLDQGTTTNVAFSDASGTIAVDSTGSDGAEQVLLLRNDMTLSQGQELQIDVPTVLGDFGQPRDFGLAVGQNHADLGNGVTGDNRNTGDFLFVSWRNPPDHLNSRGFNGNAEVGQVQAFGAASDRLFIARLENDDIEFGYYSGGTRVVMRTETPATTAIYDNIGFYADLRADGDGFTGADNLRLVSGTLGDLTINGDLTMSSTGILEFDFTDQGFSTLDVTGAAALDGTVKVNLLDGFMPTAGDYAILSASGGITDNTLLFDLPTLAGGLDWDTSSFFTDGVLSVVAPANGDFNDDGDVNGADFLAWQRGFPGTFDAADLADWEANFGTTPASPAAAGVPEPASLIIAMMAAGGLAAAAVRRRSR